MITFTQYGYSPKNFVALVAASGAASNAQFMRDNGIKKATFYRYANGETSLSWLEWQSLASKYGANVETTTDKDIVMSDYRIDFIWREDDYGQHKRPWNKGFQIVQASSDGEAEATFHEKWTSSNDVDVQLVQKTGTQ
jgi:hypothetical protein